jgi:uncharacterized membrane protein
MVEFRPLRPPRRRLDLPREPKRIALPRLSSETFGRFAETFAKFMGTPRFLLYMTLFVIAWLALNLIGIFGLRWDPYPFILLNLFFSTQASYAAPLILLAQNRQAERDRLAMEEDRRRAAMQKADTEFMARELASLRLAIGEVATRDFLRSELGRILEELQVHRSEHHEPEDFAVEPVGAEHRDHKPRETDRRRTRRRVQDR